MASDEETMDGVFCIHVFFTVGDSADAARVDPLTTAKMKECRWVKPNLVCQVAFVEWTDAGKLRRCSFVAMRDDKKPGTVVRET